MTGPPNSTYLPEGLIPLLAHDLRTPLSGVLLNLELLARNGADLNPHQREDIAGAAASARTLASIVATTCDVGRMEAAQMELAIGNVDLVAVARAALEAREWPGSEREVDLDLPDDLWAHCDRDLTRRVISELVAAALAVTPEDTPICLRASRWAGHARVEVEDGGRPIPDEWRAKMFHKAGVVEARDAGYRHAPALGLVFCRLAVEAQGGQIGSSSPANGRQREGNVFWFDVPLAAS